MKWFTKRAPQLSCIVESAAAESIGRREYMEDRWARDTFPLKGDAANAGGVTAHIFGVYDGHGGSECCDYIKENLHKMIASQPEFSICAILIAPMRVRVLV